MSKLNSEQKQIFEQVVRLFNLKNRRLPEDEKMRHWIESIYKADLDTDILIEGVDALSRSPEANFSVGDLLFFCNGMKRRRRQEEEERAKTGSREHDPQAEEVSRRCGRVFDLLPDGSGPPTLEESLALWRSLKELADEMIEFYQGEQSREGGRSLDQWKKERGYYIGKIIEREEALERRAG